MILVVNMRNRKLYEQQDGGHGIKCRVEQLSGQPALIMHYAEVGPATVRAVKPQAVVITGSPDPWPTVRLSDLYGLNDLLHTAEIPILGICQGHQLIGHCFNRDLRKIRRLPDEPMRKCRPGEPDTGALAGHPGYYYANAFAEVKILRADPIFAGLTRHIRVRENHRCEIKKLPRGFSHLATSSECAYEMIRHGEQPLYGMQFHAECWAKPYMAGRTILLNFFRLAGVLKA